MSDFHLLKFLSAEAITFVQPPISFPIILLTAFGPWPPTPN